MRLMPWQARIVETVGTRRVLLPARRGRADIADIGIAVRQYGAATARAERHIRHMERQYQRVKTYAWMVRHQVAP